MKLSELMQGVETAGAVFEAEITAICFDTRNIEPGSLFFCLVGAKNDGHLFAREALEKGAAAVVCQRDMGLGRQIITPDTRRAFSVCCANRWANPQRDMKLVGITGTNGKTTTAYLIRDMLSRSGLNVGLVSTVEISFGGSCFPARYTTPEPSVLFAMLNEMRLAGCSHVVMEVSSHALEQSRVAPCEFEVGVFTNLTQDHLDYHKTMEQYYEAKTRLFEQSRAAVVNIDDPWGQRLAAKAGCPVATYGCTAPTADYKAGGIKLSASGCSFTLSHSGRSCEGFVPVPGSFSVQNALAAVAACGALGIDFKQACHSLKSAGGAPGRFEILISDENFTIIRDYAHTPDALEKILTALREVSTARIVTLFGCAGERERDKRSEMAQAVAKLSDFVVMSLDNPRGEDTSQILGDAMPGLLAHKTPFLVIPERGEAIESAIKNLNPGDILLLAGKGHEDYQVLSHATLMFDEKEIVGEILRKRAQS
jgi:UDP-N-acetylmuramoyl-L-alanyl-D-glutamate--2,6-diaminopimelate ligase